jgi:2-polyprenyl-3-methyl-5-hydroxy-6-metoxy-1,4-benzoquinol methylase
MNTLSKPYLADPVRCACCLNTDPAQFDETFEKYDVTFLKCRRCGFVYLPWHYRKNISYTDYKDEAVLKQVRAGNDWLKIQRHLLRFKLIQRYQPDGKLFDLGVGWGHFLLAGQQLGYDVYGIEISQNPYTYAKEDLKLPVDHIDFFAMDKPAGSYDVITLWDVLEHIDEPDKMVDRMAYLLKPGGYVFIQVPAIDSYIARNQGVNWKMIGLDHVNYFSKKTITQLLERYGFEVVKIKSSIELKIFLMYTILPWLKGRNGSTTLTNRGEKVKSKSTPKITSAERQEFYNKTTNRPKWMLRLMVFAHNMIYNLLTFFRIGEEMIVVARKK